MQTTQTQITLQAKAIWLALVLLLILCASQAGCARYKDYSTFVKTPAPLVTSTEYRLAPPDQIMITSRRVRELANHEDRIRPDGKIALPLLGSVMVAGKTPEEISVELSEKAKEYYEEADITVRVVGFNSKKIYVWGEVAQPGPYTYDGANTILGTLAKAQPTRLAENNRINILRPNKDGKLVKRMTIDLDEMTQTGDVKLDAVLEENDIIYVPANVLASIGLVFQQILLPIQPAASTMKGPADIHDSATSTAGSSNGGR